MAMGCRAGEVETLEPRKPKLELGLEVDVSLKEKARLDIQFKRIKESRGDDNERMTMREWSVDRLRSMQELECGGKFGSKRGKH
jgi:hypothetical protein